MSRPTLALALASGAVLFAAPAPAAPPERSPGYVARSTRETPEALLEASDAPWAGAERIRWGPESVATVFRALWTQAGLAVRYDVTDASPWHTLTKFDERLWTEEVVELFLDVGATGRSYAEFEWNPSGAVVDLWIDRAENRFDRDWNAVGFRGRVHARRDASGRTSGWTALGFLPWSALAAKAPPGTALPPKRGDRWRFNVFRIDRPFGPGEPEKDVQYLAWSPTGEGSFHAPAAFREIEFAGAAGTE